MEFLSPFNVEVSISLSPSYPSSHNEGLQLLIPTAEQGLRRHLSVVVRQKRYVPSGVRLPLLLISVVIALDTSAMLPLLNSLTHLTYLTSTSPRIRDILVNDGGLERLLEIMQESALPRDHCLEPNFDWFGLRGPPTASILTQAQQVALKHSLAFQCVVNVGVRGSETIRTRLVQSGALNVVAQIMEVWLQQKGVWIYPGPLGSQASVERAIAAGILPPVQDGSVDWRAGYSRYTSRRSRDKERERSGRDGPPPPAESSRTDERQDQDNREMSVDQPSGSSNPLRGPRRPPTGRERHDRVSAWVEERAGGRSEDDSLPQPGTGTTAEPYPIAAWWNTIRRGIELNLGREDIPTQEDINLFGITPATVPAWTRLFASVRSSGDNRRRLIRRLLRGDSSAQSIMEVMFLLGIDPWATKERLKRAVRVSPQGEVMIVTTHQDLGPTTAARRPTSATAAETIASTAVPQTDTTPTVHQRFMRSSIQRMEQVAADNARPAMPTPRASENSVPSVSSVATTSAAPTPIPISGEASARSRQHARRGGNPASEEFGDSSGAPSVASSASDHPDISQSDTIRAITQSRLAPRPDSAASSRTSRSPSRLGQRNAHLLDAGNDANSSGPSNNPSPISTPTNGLMARGSNATIMAVPRDLSNGRGNGRERSGTITATGFQVDGVSSDTLATRLARATGDDTHESMDIDEEDRPASRATTDAEGNGEAGEGEDVVIDETIDIVGINGEENGDPLMGVLTEVEPNPDAQAELDIAMGAPRGAPGAAATTVAGEMTPRVPVAGLPMTGTAVMASPEPTDALEVEDNEDAGTETQRQPVRQTQLPVTAVVIAAGAPRSFSDLGHLVASMDRNADPHVYTDDTILLSLQLFAYLSKYPHVRSAFHHPTRPLHYGVEISPEANLPERPNFAKTANMFSLVERFTFRAAPPDPDMPKIPADIQYWAGVIMRNACRKDDSRAGIRQCANMSCGKWEAYPRQFAKCRRCRKAKYCSKDCQSRAWQEGHRFW